MDELAGLFAPLTARDLLNLPRFRMALRSQVGGERLVITPEVCCRACLPRFDRRGAPQQRRARRTVASMIEAIGAVRVVFASLFDE